MKRITLAGIFGASAVAISLSSLPASAAVTGCSQGSNSGQFLFSDITPGFQCYVGDKVYENFANFVGFDSNDQFSTFQGGGGLIHTLNIQAGSIGGFFSPGSYTYDYRVRVWTGDNKISGYSTGATTSVPGVAWTKDLTSTGSPPTATVSAPTATSGLSTFSPWVTQADFNGLLTVTSGAGVTQFTDAVYQSAPVPTPSPLPIIGASAAFGFSRRIRSRIRQSA